MSPRMTKRTLSDRNHATGFRTIDNPFKYPARPEESLLERLDAVRRSESEVRVMSRHPSWRTMDLKGHRKTMIRVWSVSEVLLEDWQQNEENVYDRCKIRFSSSSRKAK